MQEFVIPSKAVEDIGLRKTCSSQIRCDSMLFCKIFGVSDSADGPQKGHKNPNLQKTKYEENSLANAQ